MYKYTIEFTIFKQFLLFAICFKKLGRICKKFECEHTYGIPTDGNFIDFLLARSQFSVSSFENNQDLCCMTEIDYGIVSTEEMILGELQY